MKFLWFFTLAFAVSLIFTACSDATEKMDIPQAVSTVSGLPVPVAEKKTLPNPGKFRTAEEMVAAGFKRYGIEKGALIFRLDGVVNGTEHLFFDNWGWREAKYTRTTTDAGTFQERTNEVQYIDGELRYVYHPDTKTADYFESPQIQQTADRYQTKDMVAVGIEIIKNMGGEPAGTGKIGHIECEIWELKKYRTTLYMWQGLTMFEQSFTGNLPVRRTCVQIKTEEEIPLEKLVMPEGVKIANAK